jgi:hypothetical protein
MNCDRIRELIPECLAGRLDAATRQKVIDHVDTCAACRGQLAELGVVWRGLETMPQPEPTETMRRRFHETLAAYEEGFQDAQRRHAMTVPVRPRWAGWWPARPAWQIAFASAFALLCLIGGYRFAKAPGAPNPEMVALRSQIDGLRQMVALSLLQQQSPNARMRGVSFSQMAQADPQVEQALLFAVSHDPNVNVRISAVDALAKFANNPDVKRALVDAVPVQDSPLVQIELIDLLVQIHDKDAAEALRKLAQNSQLDDAVRQEAASGLQKIGAAK